MANLRETSVWEAGIYQFETSDPVMGGENGIDNRPTRQLANRTLWLKNKLAEEITALDKRNLSLYGDLGATDLNTLHSTDHYGVHHQSLHGGATVDLNYPVALAGTLLVVPSRFGALQMYIPSGQRILYVRDTVESQTYGPWRAIGEVVDTLASESTTASLSAGKGKHLSDNKADKNTTVSAGDGLTGGGTLAANRTLALGTPGTITANSGNTVTAESHTHAIHAASLLRAGVVQLSNAINSGADDQAATPKAVRDAINAVNRSNLSLYGNLSDTDLNTLHSTGHYGVHHQALHGGASFDLNYPVNLAGTLLVMPSRFGALQMYIPSGQRILYVRDTVESQTYGPWRAVGDVIPSGTVAYFAGATAPAGWLKANGATVSRTTYANLFAAIGTTYGAGNGSSTFNLPDLRGEFVRGWSDGRNVDSGRTLGSTQADALKSHSHALWGIGGSGNISQAERLGSANAGVIGDQDSGAAYLTTNGAGTQLIRDSGDAETRPRNIALLACIKI